MSPLTRPLSTTAGAATEPSMTPNSLTDSEPSAAARTLPATRPSTCRPPANSMSPWIAAFLPIRVSMRPLLRSRRPNMVPPAQPARAALSDGIDLPGESLAVGCHALAARTHLDRHRIGLEGRRQRDRLLGIGVVAEIEGQLGRP